MSIAHLLGHPSVSILAFVVVVVARFNCARVPALELPLSNRHTVYNTVTYTTIFTFVHVETSHVRASYCAALFARTVSLQVKTLSTLRTLAVLTCSRPILYGKDGKSWSYPY